MTPLTMLPMTQLKNIFLLFYSTKGSSGWLQPAVEQQPLSGLGQHSCCGGEHRGMWVRLMSLMLIHLHVRHVRLVPFTGVTFCTAMSFQLAPKTAYSRHRGCHGLNCGPSKIHMLKSQTLSTSEWGCIWKQGLSKGGWVKMRLLEWVPTPLTL